VSAEEQVARIGRNTLFNGVRSVIGAAIAFATSVVVARGLGPTELGYYTLAVWTALGATIVLSEGLSVTIVKSVSQHDLRADRPTVLKIVGFGVRTQLAVAFAGAAVLALAAGLLAEAFGIPGGRELFVLAAVWVVFGSFIEVVDAPIFGAERQGLLLPLKTALVAGQLAAAAFVLFVLDAGVTAVLVSQVVVLALSALLHSRVVSRVLGVRSLLRLESRGLDRRRLVRTASVLALSSTVGLVVFKRSEVFILGYFSPSSDVAFYSIAYSMADALQLIVPTALAAAIFPSITRAFAARDHAFARRAYESQLRLTALATAPVAVAGSVLSGQVIDVLYGSAYAEAAVPLAILLWSAGVNRLGQCALGALVGAGYERLLALTVAACAVVDLGLALLLIPTYGVGGAVAAEVSTQILLAVATIAVVWRTTGFGFPSAGVVRILAANVPLLVALLLVADLLENGVLEIVVGLALVLPLYGLGLWVARALTVSEKRYLRERVVSRLNPLARPAG
jgi:O-antigen/teichoic acid export membrane protein